jgi:hypothetical protein
VAPDEDVPSRHRRRPRTPEETAGIVDAALAAFEPPPGWRVLRGRHRLEVRWTGPDERWASFSMQFVQHPTADAMFSRQLDDGSLVVTFDCSDLDDETVFAASELVTPMQRVLARAAS